MASKSKLKKIASARRQKEHDAARIQKEIDRELKRFNLHPDQIKMRKRPGGRKVIMEPVVRSGIVYRETPRYPSVTAISGTYVATRYERMRYTGDKLIGIGVLHKSNLVPIFNEEHAKDMSQMRRN